MKFQNSVSPTLKSKEYILPTFHRSNQDTSLINRPIVKEGEWVEAGDLLADCSSSNGGELSLGYNILIAYMPWEGYNYEDAILISEKLVYDDIYTSIHIEKYELNIQETQLGLEQITRTIPYVNYTELEKLDDNGIVKIGSVVKEGDILIGKVTPLSENASSAYHKLLNTILEKEFYLGKDTSLRVPKGVHAKVIDIQFLHPKNKKQDVGIFSTKNQEAQNFQYINIYLAEKRRIQVGDKMSGRHGNKGIISKILPQYDMPYLPNGVPVDMILNPLGVPSRMNVGQIYECLLGLAGKYLGENYKIVPFDEIHGSETSRSLVYSQLYKATRKTKQLWLLNPNYPGKISLFDGRTGECFEQDITVGYSYILKLVHLVDDKIHARSTGPYSLVTQQPLRGRSKQGGQRVGEMEVWALEAYGAAFILLEILSLKSDDMMGRMTLWSNLLKNQQIYIGTPESFKVLVCELQALCLDIGLFRLNSKGLLKQIDHLLTLP